MTLLIVVAAGCAVIGLVFGSFANVVIHRVPARVSVISPPSACPACEQPIRPIDNIPVVSWLRLRGQCRHCSAPISSRYPLVELSSAALFGVVAVWTGAMDPPDWWALPGYLLFVWMLLVVTVIDAQTRKIPNRLTYPLTPVLLVLLGAAALINGEPGNLLRALIGGVAAFLFLLLLALINPRGMGMGDVKFAAFLGIGLGYLGYASLVAGLFAAFLLGGLISITLILTRLRGRKDLIPFGPYLALGALIGLLWGRPLVEAYIGMTGLA